MMTCGSVARFTTGVYHGVSRRMFRRMEPTACRAHSGRAHVNTVHARWTNAPQLLRFRSVSGDSTLRYMTRFSCIGPACEDNCCHDWKVSVDHTTHEKLL